MVPAHSPRPRRAGIAPLFRTRQPCPQAPGWGTGPNARSAPSPGTARVLPLPEGRVFRVRRGLSVLAHAGRRPTPTAPAWHAAGRRHRARQNAEFEVTAQRRFRFAEMESRADAGAGLGTSGGMLWSLDDAGPAARGRGHCPLPPRTRSMRSVQAADPAEDAGTGFTDLTCSHVHVRLATSLRRFVRPALPTWAVGGEDESRHQCGHGRVDLLQAGPGGDDPDHGLAHVAVDGPQGLGPGMRAAHDWPAIARGLLTLV